MPTPVTLIPGDGIGPSIADATVRVLEAAGADVAWDVQQAGQAGVAAHGDPMPDATLESALTDFNDISFALGGRFLVADWMAIAATYTHFIYFSRELSDADSELDELELPTRVPDASGKYSQAIGVLNANVEMFF